MDRLESFEERARQAVQRKDFGLAVFNYDQGEGEGGKAAERRARSPRVELANGNRRSRPPPKKKNMADPMAAALALAIAPSSVPLQLAKAEAFVGAGKFGDALAIASYGGRRDPGGAVVWCCQLMPRFAGSDSARVAVPASATGT